jgi:hypothetical protein
MERRTFLSLVPATGLALLAPKLAVAKEAPKVLWKEVVLLSILRAEANARSFAEEHPTTHLWELLRERAHTRKGREEVNETFNRISKMRMKEAQQICPCTLSGQRHRTDLFDNHLEDLQHYFAYRRYLSFMGYPLSGLRLDSSASTYVEALKNSGKIAPEAEMLGSADTFEMTCYMIEQLGWDKVKAVILPRESCRIA